MIALTATAISVLAATSIEAAHIYYSYRKAGGIDECSGLGRRTDHARHDTAAANVIAKRSENGKFNATPIL